MKIQKILIYIDFRELSQKSVYLVAEWDSPVQIEKKLRSKVLTENLSETDITMDSIDVENTNMTTIIDNPNTILMQKFFSGAENFYEYTTQRLMPFVDTSTINGAKAIYGDSIPEEIVDIENKHKARKNIGWARNDVFFYDVEAGKYVLPQNADKTILISADLFPEPEIVNTDTYSAIYSKKIKEGKYNSSQSPSIEPTVYENKMRKYKFHKQYNPSNASQMQELFEKTNGDIKLSHYLFAINDPDITRAGNIMHFEENEDKTGYLKQYPLVKFIYAHSFSVPIAGNECELGGKIILKLNNVQFKVSEPIETESITVSTDSFAVYDIQYSLNSISFVFKRGLMPNEKNKAKATSILIRIENLSTISSVAGTIQLYSLIYDLTSSNQNHEKYSFIKTISLQSTYSPYFSLPSVILRSHIDEIAEYSLHSKFSRFGVHIQELLHHASVYTTREAHHITNPGLQLLNLDFSSIMSLGISSMPFVEYIGHCVVEAIPSSIGTSRVEWSDIWGRRFAQPVRAVFIDLYVQFLLIIPLCQHI